MRSICRQLAIPILLTCAWSTPAHATKGQVIRSEKIACPSRDFPTFITTFAASVPVQNAYTNFPLSTSRISDGDPEPVTVTNALSRDQVDFPILPAQKERETSGLVATIARSGTRHATWKLAKPDTDYQTAYHFRLYKCWYLYRIAHESL